MKNLQIKFDAPMMLNIFIGALVLALTPTLAMAATGPGVVLCGIANYASTDMGRGIATLAVISVGVGAAFGRASWTQAVLVCVGISVVLGASTLVSMGFGIDAC